ncbi:putative neuraminidase [Aminobacter aganoensis]|uniref:Putative neuraminidase n=2 Tax=Aminobacter aganoensis TaxID=83264 RepID=A0A7X0KM88_9HYPH|nr:putative neuraminidase [Aminobacter aganoensis]
MATNTAQAHPSAAVTTHAEVAAQMDGKLHQVSSGRSDAFLASPTVQNHAANLSLLPDGTLACVWFGGTMEGMGDISVYLSRLAPGSDSWSAPEKMSDDPQKSEQNPLLFNAPDGKVWLLYTSQTSGHQDGAVVKRRISEDGGKSFGKVSVLCDIPGTFVRQPIIINGRGEWLLPVFRCIGRPGTRWSGDVDTAAVLVSTDAGASWTMHDVPDSLGAVHMNIVALGSEEMVALYRNRFSEQVLRSRSLDGGRSWSAPEATDLPNNNSSVQAVRTADGRIAIVYNHANASMSDDRRLSLYDEIEGDEPVAAEPATEPEGRKAVWGVPRAPLSLAFSSDGGESFGNRIDLETGDGFCLTNNSKDGLNREFSYPSILATPDGVIHVAFTYFRRAIKYVRLSPGAY